jgi:hypothetical protein
MYTRENKNSITNIYVTMNVIGTLRVNFADGKKDNREGKASKGKKGRPKRTKRE